MEEHDAQFRAVHTKYIGVKLEISYVCWYEPSVETQAGIFQVLVTPLVSKEFRSSSTFFYFQIRAAHPISRKSSIAHMIRYNTSKTSRELCHMIIQHIYENWP